jgi:hypothetical protein
MLNMLMKDNIHKILLTSTARSVGGKVKNKVVKKNSIMQWKESF